MNPSAAVAAGLCDAPSSEAGEEAAVVVVACTRMGPARCTPSSAPSVATTPWSRSDLVATGLSTVATASAGCEKRRPQASNPH